VEEEHQMEKLALQSNQLIMEKLALQSNQLILKGLIKINHEIRIEASFTVSLSHRLLEYFSMIAMPNVSVSESISGSCIFIIFTISQAYQIFSMYTIHVMDNQKIKVSSIIFFLLLRSGTNRICIENLHMESD
ncbi:hypothetical protein ACJX0J_039501, partial [Zea mays]